MAIRRMIICLLILFASCPAIAQEEELLKDIMESLAENLPEDFDPSEFTEQMVNYRRHPIDLNNTSPEELKKLVFLSALQISNYFAYLRANGKLIDVLELQSIDGFDVETINRLTLFARASPSSELKDASLKEFFNKSNNDLILRFGRVLNTQKGFKPLAGSRYLGGAEKLLLRYKYKFKDAIAVSLVAEKDAGEQLWQGRSGVDHLSGSISLNKVSKVIEKAVLGDYSLQFGQGLTLWSGFAFGKGPDVTSVAGKDAGLRPYTSSNEASFLRGIAGTLNISKHLQLTSFGSMRKLDASLKTRADGIKTLQNINVSGLHRTATELKNQKSLRQQVFGSALQYTDGTLNVGLVGYHSIYQHEFVTGTQQYNQFGFTGKSLTNGGVHYNHTLGNVYLFGELAHSFGSGWALVNGAMASLSAKISAVVLFRNYDRDYHNFFSNGIGEGSEINNERGCYAGINYAPDKKWMFSCYGDYFKFPWLRYRVDDASSGYEGLGQISYTPSKTLKVVTRYKREIKEQNADSETEMDGAVLSTITKQNFRMEYNWKLNRVFSFQQRAEVCTYKKGSAANEQGYLVCNDVNFRFQETRLSGNMRVAYFNTSSYNTRIYAYEDDVLYGSSFGGYYDTGIRTYVNLRYTLLRQLDVWCRYALYVYEERTTIGSGLDEIAGNKKSDFKVQMRYQF